MTFDLYLHSYHPTTLYAFVMRTEIATVIVIAIPIAYKPIKTWEQTEEKKGNNTRNEICAHMQCVLHALSCKNQFLPH